MGKRKSRAKPHIKKGRKPEEAKPDRRLTPNQRAFLKAYAESGLVGLAAEAAGISRDLHARWLKSSAAYRAAFEPAHERAIETMEAEARRRACDGVVEPVYQGGVKCGTRRRYSDVLLIFLLKAARPEKYADRGVLEVDDRREVAGRFPELAKPGRAAATATLSAARKAARPRGLSSPPAARSRKVNPRAGRQARKG